MASPPPPTRTPRCSRTRRRRECARVGGVGRVEARRRWQGVACRGGVRLQHEERGVGEQEERKKNVGWEEEEEEEEESWTRLREEAAAARLSGNVPLGDVYLVGAGPGDPSLLTLRAAEVLARADVVLRDRLISDDILEYVNKRARIEYVGKKAGFHTRTQEQIHELLYIFAETGKTVVRLKGGDPFVFGRGGEELAYLQARGVKVHTVPGITASCGICAALGVPFTHRGLAEHVMFLTGHARDGMDASFDEVAAAAAAGTTTLVVYMGLGTLPQLQETLLLAGTDPRMPALAVERGTTSGERVVVAPLAELAERVVAEELRSPTLVIIGHVVSLGAHWKQEFLVMPTEHEATAAVTARRR